jgi:hypothetical protein
MFALRRTNAQHATRDFTLTRSYITHSNKALRPLNMHLNLRRPPATFPIPFFRSKVTVPSAAPPAPAKSLSSRRQSTTSTVMASIPPSHNPRGELIFSSRVDKTFREGYERYRAAFERRREEKAREEARRNARWFSGVGASRTPTTSTPTPPASRRGTPPPSLGAAGGEKALAETRRAEAGMDQGQGRAKKASRRSRGNAQRATALSGVMAVQKEHPRVMVISHCI